MRPGETKVGFSTPLGVMTTISPGSNFTNEFWQPMMSSAQVSELSAQPQPSLPQNQRTQPMDRAQADQFCEVQWPQPKTAAFDTAQASSIPLRDVLLKRARHRE